MCKSIMTARSISYTASVQLSYHVLGLYPGLHAHCLVLKGLLRSLYPMSSENVLEMVRLYSHCSCRYLTLLLVNGRYAYANFVSLAVILFYSHVSSAVVL